MKVFALICRLLKKVLIIFWNEMKHIKSLFMEKVVSQMPEVMNIVSHKTEKARVLIKNLYKIISVISTLTIQLGLITYIYGHIAKNNQSDNDLIMNQIMEEVNGEEIIAINVADIHGFGNDSIIVTTNNVNMVSYGEEHSNNLVILDIAENEILHKMEDLLGIKSRYKTTFSYTILSDGIRFVPETEYVLDIIGDSTKEIIVKYYVFGSNYGANSTAIFRYSYIDSKYKLIGTYPESEKVNLYEYDNDGNYIGRKAQQIETGFNNDIINGNSMYRCYDNDNSFNLNQGRWSGREYWVKSSIYGYVLATVNIDEYENEPAFINIYEPMYNSQNENLNWNLIYSENIQGFSLNYMEDDLVRTLMDIMECQVTLVERCNDWGY